MGQIVFNPEINRFCMSWATPIPGSATKYGGPIRSGSEAFRGHFRTHQEALFEQLLLFDSVNLSINGPNVIAPLIYRSMGANVLEDLLEQDALSFTVWTPNPIMGCGEGVVKATGVGRFGDGNGSELDIEKIVDVGLRIQQVNMPDWYKASIRKKLICSHRLLDSKLPETAWEVAGEALKRGELITLGLVPRDSIIESSEIDGKLFLSAAEAILDYRYVLQYGLASQNDLGIFNIFGIGAQNLNGTQSLMSNYTVISEYEKFPNLKALYSVIDKPFKVASEFRKTHTACAFRDWISQTTDTKSQTEIIRGYVDACSKRKGLFESAPAKFLKLTGMVAVGHFVLPEAHLGEAAGVLLSGVPSKVVGEITGVVSEVGLGVIDSFIIDNLKVGWTPRAYFDRLQRFQRQNRRSHLA